MKEAEARGALNRARKKLKLDWVGFHDFGRFPATQWHIHGVDLKTMLGHTDIQTTMRYVKFSPKHAANAVRAAQQREQLTVVDAAVS